MELLSKLVAFTAALFAAVALAFVCDLAVFLMVDEIGRILELVDELEDT